MTRDLDELKDLLDAATPQPDAARKAENIQLAKKNYENLQEFWGHARPTSDRPENPGFVAGVQKMLRSIPTRGLLTASTAIVAVYVVMLSPLGDTLMPPRTTEAPLKPVVVNRTAEAADQVSTYPAPALAEEADAAVELGLAAESYAGTTTAKSRAQLSAPAPSGPALEAPVIFDDARLGTVESDTESFANAETNPVHVTTQKPVSTFSIDVDTASYAFVRNSLTNGQLPPKDAIRVEELVNYFTYDYAAPSDQAAFRPTISLSQTPWNSDTQLLQIGIEGAAVEVEDRPPLNLVFLIDTSGSMEAPNKLPLLKQSFRLMLGQLRPEDQVAIVTYAGSAGEVLAPTAAAMAEEGEVNRVILATDGDFNVGLSDPEALKDFIADKRDSGTYLSVLGFGRGNLDDSTMQALAQNGNGQAAYIDTLSEAQKVLVDQLTGALFPIADDVKIQVEFNPAAVAEYRLIGYETRALRREDFNNDKVDAGDIGAGHQVTALYEVTPVGSPAILNDNLRYAQDAEVSGNRDELAFLRLRYKAPGETASNLIETPIAAEVSGFAGFAAAMAGFGQLLRGTSYLGDWSMSDAIALANQTKGEDPFGYRTEAIQLMRLAESLSQN